MAEGAGAGAGWSARLGLAGASYYTCNMSNKVLLYSKHWARSRSALSDSLRPHGLQPARLLSLGLSRQEYVSGVPCPPPGDLLNPGIKPRSPALQADSLLV